MKVCWACEKPFPCAEHGESPPDGYDFGGPEGRVSVPSTRFEVSDPICGTVDNYPDRAHAIDRARGHQAAHAVENDPDPVTVFDRMAHIGDTCLWGSDGRGIEKRTR